MANKNDDKSADKKADNAPEKGAEEVKKAEDKATSSGSGSGAANTDPLAQLKAQELAVILNPIKEFLTALQQPNANVETLVSGFQIVKLAELQNIPAIESIGINNIAAIILEKLNSWESSFTGSAAKAA